MNRRSDLPALDPASRDARVDQIVTHFRAAITEGRLRGGDRLPTIRAVAQGAGVTRATVLAAYKRLADEGLVRATVGRGTEVVGSSAAPIDDAGLSRAAVAATLALRRAPTPPLVPPGVRVIADFGSLQPDPGSVPVDAVADALDHALRDVGAELLGYGDPAGNPELRRLLAGRHSTANTVDPERVLVTSGAQQGIDVVLRTLTEPGDAVAVVLPTYPQLFGAFAAHQLRLLPIPVADGRIDTTALREMLPRVRLVYVMPSFHNPTGVTLDAAARRALIAALADSRVPILEDEVECELRFAGAELPSLQSLDLRKRTVTVRSFSKGLFPGVRIGWVEADPEWIAPMAALKRFCDLECSPLLQAALARLLASGTLDRDLVRLRGELAARHATLRDALRRAMPEGVRWSEPEGGLSLWVELPGGADSRRVATAAARDGVLVTPGDSFHPDARTVPGFRIALSRAPSHAITAGIEILARHVRVELAAHAGMRTRIPLVL
ncbi:MAG: PLP-dependent aminotransferase family protein [Planctomycetota bacterium]